jgi:hypothetical protein
LGLVYCTLIGGGKPKPPVKPFRSWPRLIAYEAVVSIGFSIEDDDAHTLHSAAQSI